jgi:di/tricarboxylate transporter
LLVGVALLVSERLRVDLVALLILVVLAVAGLVTPEEALSGFSSPAVVTVWAVFILSAGLARTGVASLIGRHILKWGGKQDSRLVAASMVLASGLSAVLNNVGVVAMLLPVTNDVARKSGQPASKFLMPLASAALLGGTLTLIGSAANVLVSNILEEVGQPALGFFELAWVGLPLVVGGVLFMSLVGWRLLPQRNLGTEFRQLGAQAGKFFELEERFYSLHIPEGNQLVGKTLAESHLGSALKLNVISITRRSRSLLAPEPDFKLRSGDQLLVVGKSDWLEEISGGQQLTLEASNGDKAMRLGLRDLMSDKISVVEAGIPPDSALTGQTLSGCNFREQYNANVLAIWRGERPLRTALQDIPLRAGDTLLVQAPRPQLNRLRKSPNFAVAGYDAPGIYQVSERLLLMGVPKGSGLAGKTLADSRLADAFGLSVLGVVRGGKTKLMPHPKETLAAGDKLLVEGKLQDVQVLRALQGLRMEPSPPPALSELESEEIGLVEAVVSPHSKLDGKTLRQLSFREKYGLSVLAIWRAGQAYRSNLREVPLRFGDSLLIYGNRNRLKMLADEEDFLVLSQGLQEAPRREKARLAVAIMGAVVLSVALGWLPIQIAAVAGAAAMILTNCLSMDEAYRSIQWQAIFLIAGTLPLGLALQKSGAAGLIAGKVVLAAQPWGTAALLAGLFLLTVLASQLMHGSVVAVLMTPIALHTAAQMSLPSHTLAILVAVACSLSFMTPIAHPVNVLVMGPGGYHFRDYVKTGLPLTLITLAITLFVLLYLKPPIL